MKIFEFKGFKSCSPVLAFSRYFRSRLNYWKIDVWQLGADDLTSEWNSMRPPQDCNCRGRIDIDYYDEMTKWYFLHPTFCLDNNEQKIEEFTEPILAFVEKEGQRFWKEKEAAWTRIEQKAQEINYEIKDNDFLIKKYSIMNCHNEGDLDEEEQAQTAFLNNFQNQNYKPTSQQQIQHEKQQAREREDQRQQKQAEQRQKEAKFLEKVTEKTERQEKFSSLQPSNSEKGDKENKQGKSFSDTINKKNLEEQIILAEKTIREKKSNPSVLAKLIEIKTFNSALYQILNQNGKIDKLIVGLQNLEKQNDCYNSSISNRGGNKVVLIVKGVILAFIILIFSVIIKIFKSRSNKSINNKKN